MNKILSNNYAANAVAFGLLLVAWQIIYLCAHEPLVFPSIETIINTAYTMILTKKLWITYWNTISMLLMGWVLSSLCITIAVTCSVLSPLFRRIFECYCAYFNSLPNFVLIPFFILFFGLTNNILVITIVFSVFFIMSHQILGAIDTIKLSWGKQITNLNWSYSKSMIHVYIPAAAPILFSMFSMTWTYMWRTLISLEVVFGGIGGYFGLGTYLTDVKNTLDVDKMYVVLFVIATSGFMLNVLLNKIEKRFTW